MHGWVDVAMQTRWREADGVHTGCAGAQRMWRCTRWRAGKAYAEPSPADPPKGNEPWKVEGVGDTRERVDALWAAVPSLDVSQDELCKQGLG